MRFLTVTMLLTAGLIHANTYPLQFAPSGHVLYVSGYTVGAAGVSNSEAANSARISPSS